MKILISVDLEGVAGIVHAAETVPERHDYERGRRLMTAEANAVVAGILDAEPSAEVLVADSHGPYRNILPEDLDRRARLIRGKPRGLGMVAGLQDGVQMAMFVGYHARAGVSGAVLAHTMADGILDVRIGGVSYGEIGLNTLLAASYGVPVVLASGDDAACEEFSAMAPRAVTVAVKRGLGQHAADTLHPEEACERLRAAAGQAIELHAAVVPFDIHLPVRVQVDLHQLGAADLAALIPGVTRNGRTLAFEAQTMADAYRTLQLIVVLTLARL
ncbi:aminopeptidase [Herbidospora galbida]|uniref:Aminopeptidase n=1 Tax=Herbidospora galbida TaxID=2575442 RepID=A0A4V5UZ12_9ACTN|nr:M55 family metallopeptidase [Herbidospora galbida]TKK86913.1 aminopeptidase [Herbidospora galbida]